MVSGSRCSFVKLTYSGTLHGMTLTVGFNSLNLQLSQSRRA